MVSDLRERLTAALTDRYTIERELGRGGMAVVYLATDHKLDRKVALKVLRPELAESLGAERLRREITIAARLSHPNILTLHDCGGDEPCLYYTMQYVEGESLRERLKREKQLPIDDALQIATEVAAALSHAHAQGIVHRDIKPENILFHGGRALVADFGIAKAVSEAGEQSVTETGMAVGTPVYMSPEQAAGERDLDGRTDLYALGCVLYEMLAGEPPYVGNTQQAMIAKKLSEPTPHVTALRDTVPPAVEAALTKVLAKAPADRFATADEFSKALRQTTVPTGPRKRPFRRLAAALGIVGVAMAASGAYGAWWFLTTGRPGTLFAEGVIDRGDRVLLADFVNRTEDSTLGYAAQEGVRAMLSDPRLIRLVDPADVRAALERMELPRHTRLDEEVAKEVAEREGAKAFIAGEIAQVGTGYQIVVRVIGTADGAELLAVRETARGDDGFFPAMDNIAESLKRGIGESVRRASSQPSLARVTTSSLSALQAFSEAVRILDTYLGSRAHAIALLRQAVAEDPGFAAAYREMATIFTNMERLAEARAASRSAYQYRDRLTELERLSVIYAYERFVTRDIAAAEAALRRTIGIIPGEPRSLSRLSDLLLSQRRWAEAESVAVRALDQGAAQDMGSNGYAAYWNAVEAQVAQNRFAAADSTLERMARSRGREGHWVGLRIVVMFAQREYDAALALVDSVREEAIRTYWIPRIHVVHGRLTEAQRELGAEVALSAGRLSARRQLWALRFLDREDEAIEHLDRWLAAVGWDSLDAARRPYGSAIQTLAEAGSIDRAKQLYAEWVALGDEHPRFLSGRYAAVGAIAMAEGMLDSAASSFLRWHRAPFVGVGYRWNRGLVEAGSAVDQLGRPDSAIALYQRALSLPSLWGAGYEDYWYPVVLRRLGELHESLGHRDEAIEYYSKFIDLWKDADPELQPQVEEARRALARLAGEPR
jgi:serine/threonine-protein kinase